VQSKASSNPNKGFSRFPFPSSTGREWEQQGQQPLLTFLTRIGTIGARALLRGAFIPHRDDRGPVRKCFTRSQTHLGFAPLGKEVLKKDSQSEKVGKP
jgi:hypothetical protein